MTTTANAPGPARPRRRRRPSVGTIILGSIGELLITVGLLLGLFVVWQLWWTDVEAAAVQRDLTSELEEAFGEAPEEIGEVRTDTPPEELEPLNGTTFGRLWVPRWDSGSDQYARTISEGVDNATVLDVLGIGHYPGSAMPGEVGNFAIAGHRQSHGKPFYDITELQLGDELVVETEDAWYVYTVTDTLIVTPDQGEVVASNPYDPGAAAESAMITLTTCHPLFSVAERYIVHGELDHWVPRDSGVPAAIGGEA